MPSPYLLEISVDTVDAALAAERGGAHRIELCARLDLGGLTPEEKLMREIRERVRLPIFTMVRPRAGDFVYTPEEIAQMRRDIAAAKRAGMNGAVLGVLTKDGRVDVERTRDLVKLAEPLPVTFHRAFDDVTDLDGALEDVIKSGAARILTSGGAPGAPGGVATLARLAAGANQRIIILPGGGINASNILHVVGKTGVREIHSGLGSVLGYGHGDYLAFEKEVRRLAAQLSKVT